MFNLGLNRFGTTPPVVKNLIYINVVMLLATWVLEMRGIDLTRILGLHLLNSEFFSPVQIVSHMFMHGGIPHLFFNMFALWMFGKVLENVWGSQRFFIYYIITGIGAATIHMLVTYLRLNQMVSEMDPTLVDIVYREGAELLRNNMNYANSNMAELNGLINGATVGASGAVYGILLAFGMLFPNTELMLLFPPMPIKAKWLVIIYGAIELYMGLSQPGSKIAHFAHLGGMIFGFILIKLWSKQRSNFY